MLIRMYEILMAFQKSRNLPTRFLPSSISNVVTLTHLEEKAFHFFHDERLPYISYDSSFFCQPGGAIPSCLPLIPCHVVVDSLFTKNLILDDVAWTRTEMERLERSKRRRWRASRMSAGLHFTMLVLYQ